MLYVRGLLSKDLEVLVLGLCPSMARLVEKHPPVKRSICALVALGKSFSESTSLTGCGSVTISSSGSDSVKYVGMRRRGTDGAVTSF